MPKIYKNEHDYNKDYLNLWIDECGKVDKLEILTPSGYISVFQFPNIGKINLKLPLYILSHTEIQAKLWFRDTFPDIHPKSGMVYIFSVDQVRGLHPITVVYLDGWFYNKNYDSKFIDYLSFLEKSGRIEYYHESDFQKEQNW